MVESNTPPWVKTNSCLVPWFNVGKHHTFLFLLVSSHHSCIQPHSLLLCTFYKDRFNFCIPIWMKVLYLIPSSTTWGCYCTLQPWQTEQHRSYLSACFSSMESISLHFYMRHGEACDHQTFKLKCLKCSCRGWVKYKWKVLHIPRCSIFIKCLHSCISPCRE